MNCFTDAFFSIILIWVRSLTNAAWTAVRSGGQQGILSWLADHWLGLLILATLAGLTLDWIVWMLRWRPYRLWFSGLRRRSARWEGNGGADSTPVYGQDYDDEVPALEPAQETEALSPEPGYEEEPVQSDTEVWSAREAPHAAYARPVDWNAPSMPLATETEAEEATDDAWTPEGAAEEERAASWPTQADPDWSDEAWDDQDEASEAAYAEDLPAEDPAREDMPAEQPLAEELPADSTPDAPAYGRPGLWPGFGWARPKPAEEASSPARRLRRSARWLARNSDAEDAVPNDFPAEELPAETLPEETPFEEEAPFYTETGDAVQEAYDAAYEDDAYAQEAQDFSDEEPAEDESLEQPSNRRKRSSFRNDIIRTVTGAPAKRRGIMRLTESQDEAISGLPPLMAREDAYHQPALPPQRKKR